jgi:parvulin-like peptidyl-prolyl isomerase
MVKQILKWQFLFSPLLLLVNCAFSHPGGKNQLSKLIDDSLIARVGSYPIPSTEYIQRYSDFLTATGIKDNLDTRRAIVTNVINETLLLHYDDSASILRNQNYVNDLERVKKQTTLAYLKDREIYAKITVNEFELRQAFERTNEKLVARHLYARTEEEANNLYQLLNMGVDFNLLARQVFTDSVLQTNGGYLGYFSWGDMDPAFEEAAYSLHVGEISLPVKIAQGYSIIKLEDRVSHPLLTENQFLQKKSHLERVLKIKKKKPSEQEYIRHIFNPNIVTFNNANLKGLLDELKNSPSKNLEFYKSKKSSSVCATYNGTSYTRNDLLRRLSELPVVYRKKITSLEELKVAVEGFILQDKLLAIAHRKGYDTLPLVVDEHKKAKESLSLKYKIQEITDKAQFSDSLIYEYYKTNVHLFSTEDELNIQEIIVANGNLADSLKETINAGGDFGMLAERYSLRKWSAANKGVMGFAPISKFGLLKETLWNSPIGELIGPVKIENHYGFFKVLNKKPSEPLAFDLIKDQARQALRFEKQRTIIHDYLVKLQKHVNIEINEQRLTTFKVTDFVSQK